MAMPISAVILAGGRATRMGGVDKGLVLLNHKPLIAHVIARLTPQVDEILLNVNREFAQYQTMGLPLLPDQTADFIGPLAGFYQGLTHAKHDYLLTVPCDAPLLPPDLAMRLMAALQQNKATIAVARSQNHAHPVFSLCKKTVLPSLQAYLAAQGRKVSEWQKNLAYTEVDFSDQAPAFTNLNTLDELNLLALNADHV